MRIATFVFLLLSAPLVLAQSVIRNVPDDAKRGVLNHVQGNIVSLDGRQVRLAPGGQIRGKNNMIIMPSALPPDSLVKYKLDQNGHLARVWILTPDEAAQPDQPALQTPVQSH